MKQKKHILRKVILTIAPMTMMVAALLIGFKNNNAVHVEALSGSGTESNPILISTKEDLEEVMSNVNNGNDYAGKHLSVTKDLSVGLSKTTNAKTFRGHLDGGGFTITLSTSTTDGAVAMFNCVGSAGSVSNIVFEGSISGVGSMSSTVCVYNYGSISNITNNCDISSENADGIIGGIAASEIAKTANIDNCVNNATISGTKYVGGIVGNLRVGSISDSTNKGEIISTSTSCAGIAGLVGKDQNTLSDVTITNCINEGNITSKGQAGGIAGGVYPQLTCIGCSNYGNITVSSSSGAGGIVGYIQSNNADAVFSITECYSDGIITTNNGWAGGVFGYFSSSSVGTMNFNDVLSASKVVDNSTNATGRVGGFMVGQNAKNVVFNFVKCQQIASISFFESDSDKFSTGYVFGKVNKNTDSNLVLNDKDHGLELSDSTKKLIRAVRKFDCAYDADIANDILNGISNLTDDEISALDSAKYFGKNDNNDTYYRSALYINNYLQNNGSGMLGLNKIVQLDAESSLTIIIVMFIAVGALAAFVNIKKRKSI